MISTHQGDLSENDLFKKMVTVSAVIHFSIFIFIILKSFLLPSTPINLESAVRVDIVGLPDKVTQLPPKEAPKANVMPAPKVEPKTEAVSLKKSKQSAIDRIKEFEKEERRKKSIESIQEDVKKQEMAERSEKARKILVKGNVINPGTALTGLAKAEFGGYVSELHSHVQSYWNLPEWLRDAKLKATVVVFIDGSGKVIKRHLERSSGDERFDDLAIKAVDDASPFPKPPEKFVDVLRVNGFRCGFPE